ncbi:MAG: efflux RND transporter permease subunit [Bacteroidetes bacterium]|nr:efflux RND transporter permease subunit [Bacteroidota bacterium]
MNIIESSLKYKHVTLSVLLLLFVVGVNSLLNMPRREDPKITIRQGLVLAYYPGANSSQVEDQVTKKLEQYLFQYEEVRKDKTFSTTRDGMVVVNVELVETVSNPDVFWSKLRHQLLVSKQLDLPAGVRGPIVNSDFGDTEAVVIGIESDHASYAQLKEYAQKLEDNLRTIPSVSKIKRIGEQKEQIVLSTSSEKVSQYGVNLKQVVSVLQSQNSINPTGEIKSDNNKTPLYTSGYYNTENEITNQIVGTSTQTGSVVRLGDVATSKRMYAEPSSKITVNGHKAMILSIQMHEGNNIVKFGEEVSLKTQEVAKFLPADVKLSTIVNQPKLVDESISHFIHEFFLAILSVVIVVLLLLPFRIAAVAAMAIPMTVAVTFALLQALGIELHQVSLAALIIVLGMVVDDAIVIADNYVELLDEGIDRWTAAWRSASDIVVPVLAATITIVASFLPMILIKGTTGEFIFALPITVAIALFASFVVALFFTPLLCYAFIKKGLHDHSENAKKKRKSLLDYMQMGYNSLLEWCVNHPKTTIISSLLTIILAGLIYSKGIKQKFFPAAERNQFVVELWMPTGTKLEKTEQAILKVENLVKQDKRVTSFATFIGMSAPRFYYNFSSEIPVTNYAQILINTSTEKTTEELSHELTEKVATLIPEGTPQVKIMQQGASLKAPVEVRVIGEDITRLKQIGGQIAEIIKKTQGSAFVRNDFAEDYYGFDIKLKEEASRLGFTTSSISQLVYTGFTGAAISSMYEGNNPVDIVLRLDDNSRQNTTNLENMYVSSPATGANVPLRQIATISPEWQTGKIMHRNGVRTLTVQSETVSGVLPSQLLAAIQPEIEKLSLPEGYRISYGGEYENKKETFSQMIQVLVISLVLIFFILIFQFRNIKEALIIMTTIPLSLFGALFGLFITGNNFSFTAFIGLIALSGIVVRNAIILVDYTNLLLKHGMDIKTAAIESGKRRLRPIFLTAMAAAIGVLPMIMSGSPMWSPLASVIAVGVVWSMIMALLTVPVLYIGIIKPSDKKDVMPIKAVETSESEENNEPDGGNLAPIIATIAFFIISTTAFAQTPLSLPQAQQAALSNNHLLKIKDLQIAEKKAKIEEDKIKKYPAATVNSTYQYNFNLGQLVIPAGSFGALPVNATTSVPLPKTDETFVLGNHHTFNAGATVYQPITQLRKIKTGLEVDKNEVETTELEKSKAATQIKQAVEKLYYGLLITQQQKEEAQAKLALANLKLYDVESALLAGKTIDVNKAGLQANIADEEQNILKLSILQEDYATDLRQLTGIEVEKYVLQEIPFEKISTESIGQYKATASTENVDIKLANLKKDKANLAIKAAQQSYRPDIGAFVGYTYQTGNTLYPMNNPVAGISLKWNVQDFFANKNILAQRNFILQQAQENIKQTSEQIDNDLEKAVRKIKQSEALIGVAQKVVNYRTEELKVQEDKQAAGLNVEQDILATKASLAKAKSDLYAAQLGYRLAQSELGYLSGR